MHRPIPPGRFKGDPAAALGIDLLGILEKSGYVKRNKTAPGIGQARWNGRDSRSTADLQTKEFSGIRANDLWNRFEFWILGRVETTLSYAEFFLRPQKLTETYCELFGLDKINLDAATQQDIKKLQERKEMLSEPELQRVISQLEDPTVDARATTNPNRSKGNAGKDD